MTLRPEPYEAYRTDAVFGALEAMRVMADEHHISMATLAMAWALAQPALTAIVIGPNRVEHLQSALGANESCLDPTVFDDLSELFK